MQLYIGLVTIVALLADFASLSIIATRHARMDYEVKKGRAPDEVVV